MSALLIRFVFILILAVSVRWPVAGATQDVWTSVGPEGGTVVSLVVDPQASAILYMTTSGGGLFKSSDGGGRWRALNIPVVGRILRIPTLLTVDPRTSGVVYVGFQSKGAP